MLVPSAVETNEMRINFDESDTDTIFICMLFDAWDE